MSGVKKVKIVTLADDYAGGGRCLAQHGISFFIEIFYQSGEVKRVLFDTGIYHEPILFNAKRLSVPLEKIDAIVLSHSHYDHTGGLLGILEKIQREDLPIVAHPLVFKKSYYKGKSTNIGMENDRTKEIAEKLGGVWYLTKESFEVIDNLFFMGQVPRVTDFEQDLTIQLQTEVNGEWIDDLIEDDSAIYMKTLKGLVIVSGCSHSGIVNIVKHGIHLSRGEKPYAVIGGFHLLTASEERIIQTAESLKELGVEKLITGHCTGGVAEYLFQQIFTTSFQKLYAGKTIQYEF
ncbi:MBL fold metallo-hydrolase [Tepidibacillus sp. LV47]|uniref:MBL fold metallo-hydrolase n=1 Tax=Tepidibacillus sp. LV47 TaxID=3398228 RepID=UPI003AAE65D6